MERQSTWKPGYVSTAIAVLVPLLVLIASYRPAVQWFNAAHNVKVSEATHNEVPTLPITGLKPVPASPGFPWWAFAVIISAMFAVLFLWRSGYKNVLTVSLRATAYAAERRARSYTFNADVYQGLNEKKTARYLAGLAGSFARTALALQGTSQVLNRIESAGTKLDLPPVSDGDATDSDAQEYQGMPPRIDSLTED